MLLAIEGVSAGYDGKQVVRKAGLCVAAGEIVALVGHNGAGKSTLLDAIFGLLPLDEGLIRFDESDVTRLSPAGKLRAGIAYAPQGGRVYRTLTIADNLEIGGFVSTAKARRRAISGVYDLFPILHERRHARAGLLSGGERQMLAIGMALACSPRLILLDEPSGGLAPLLVERAFETIKRIAACFAMGVLLVEQNLSEAFAIADRAYVMANGRITASGTPATISDNEHFAEFYFGGIATGEIIHVDEA
jgi:branched-chain amino acid transport system ATP-binding protein